MTIEAEVEAYIISDLLHGRLSRIDPNDSLISSGVLDSLTLLQLIAFLEEKYNIIVKDVDMNPNNFQTINIIKTFVEKKLENPS